MTVPVDVAELLALYERRGSAHYGEDVSQLDHALQCAALAGADGAHPEMVAAALLHDVGHLVARSDGDHEWRDEVDDDRHEAIGARVLAALFGPEVAGPVALHVVAKRWQCTVDPGHLATLSATSQSTFLAQGGALDHAGLDRFEAHPQRDRALALRAWDDAAKDPTADVGTLRDHEPLLRALAQRHAASATEG